MTRGALEFQVGEICTQCCARVRSPQQGEAHRFRTEIGPLPAGLRGDPRRVSQALQNLLEGAAKCCPAGVVTLRVDSLHEQGGMVLLKFEARGERRDRAPGPCEPAAAPPAETCDLELMITRGLAHWMGGDCGVEGNPAVGGALWFTAWLEHGIAAATAEAEALPRVGQPPRRHPEFGSDAAAARCAGDVPSDPGARRPAHEVPRTASNVGSGDGFAGLPAALRRIDGLDVAQGVARFSGRVDSYLRILRHFAERYGDGVPDCDNIDSDPRSFQRAVHTLRGAAGNIGATPLQAMAAALEAVLTAGVVLPGPDDVDRLMAELHALVIAIRSAVPSPALPAPDRGPVSAGDAADPPRCDRLEALLEANDFAAVQWYRESRWKIQTCLGLDADVFGAHLDNFRFDAALALLRHVRVTGCPRLARSQTYRAK